MFFLFIRSLVKVWISIIAICMGLHWLSGIARASESARRTPPAQITVRVTPIGIDAQTEQALIARVLRSPVAQAKLHGDRYHVLASQFADADKAGQDQSFRLHVYDYNRDRLYELTGSTARGSKIVAREEMLGLSINPSPSPDEFRDAVALLKKDAYFGPGILAGDLEPYRAMPGVIHSSPNPADWPKEGRIIEVGLIPIRPIRDGGKYKHEIVGVNLSRLSVIRYPAGSPRTAVATEEICGPDPSGDATTARGVTGSAQITINEGSTNLWSMIVNRPSISTGYWGSGVELRNVDYKGKRVLTRAGVPIFNVKYDGDVCGPYRDWAWQEHPYTAHGDLIEDGILQADSPPTTIFDNNDDDGNFWGVSIFTRDGATVVESEMEAGWYRYLSQWIFYPDGTIQPRWGFGGVANSCTCNLHHHHVYWRLDFDIAPSVNNVVESFDGTQWTGIHTETKQYRDSNHKMWRVTNPKTGSGYLIIPGPEDETAAGDDYGQGDFWVILSKPYELDDSQDYIGTRANIDSFVQGNDVYNQDVVIWYAGHFLHDTDHEAPDAVHILGPTLKPINW